ncbi:alpha 1,2-mannosyltransferase 2.4.1 [Neopestalotiopsis sp. 37M]|nr:alpha 1,2-mannosyltransferase 2.4.1 [Neopestalotiopsis sp. 37M]
MLAYNNNAWRFTILLLGVVAFILIADTNRQSLLAVSLLQADGKGHTLPTNHRSLGGFAIGAPWFEAQKPMTLPRDRINATFVSLARSSDVWEIAKSIRQVEDRFNKRYNYDWVFLNDQPFDETFKQVTRALVSGKVQYGTIPREHWSYPEWIDQERAKKAREDMQSQGVIYGGSESYRHMCRFESGFFFRHPLLQQYDYYWRVEPSVDFYCDISFDPFRFIKERGIKYSFVISLYEYIETIASLWDTVLKFKESFPQHIARNNTLDFLSDDGGSTYNKCHFWSNFEIADLNFFRSQAYLDYFEFLDKAGGFFYERWGDAPVDSIAAALFLNKSEILIVDSTIKIHGGSGVIHAANDCTGIIRTSDYDYAAKETSKLLLSCEAHGLALDSQIGLYYEKDNAIGSL